MMFVELFIVGSVIICLIGTAVSLGNHISELHTINYGVPHGSF